VVEIQRKWDGATKFYNILPFYYKYGINTKKEYRMKEYQIIASNHAGNLANLVNQHCAEGWEPIGGVFQDCDNRYLQPMTRCCAVEKTKPFHLQWCGKCGWVEKGLEYINKDMCPKCSAILDEWAFNAEDLVRAFKELTGSF
jgi:hypothetical protein